MATLSIHSALVDTNRPLRIAVIGGRGVPSNYSGVERICEELFSWFADRGHRITIYCRPPVLADKTARYRGMRLVRTPAPGGKNGETLSHSLTSLLHAVTRGDEGNRFDLISMHTIAPNLFNPIATLAGIPIVSHVHGLDHKREKWKGMGSKIIGLGEKIMVRTAKRLVGVNPAIIEHYKTEFGLDAALLPNGVHKFAERPIDPAVLNEFGLEAGRYIVSVGRIVPEKRLHDTIAAYAKVPGDRKMVFVGDAQHSREYLAELQKQAENDPGRRIVFTGLQRGPALEALFRSATCYVSASELEGNPSSVLECMEYGTPAILTDIDGHRPLFSKAEGYDLQFKPGDVDALTERLTRVLANPTFAALLAERCRAHVRSEFAWPVLAERTERLYLEVVGRQASESQRPQAVA